MDEQRIESVEQAIHAKSRTCWLICIYCPYCQRTVRLSPVQLKGKLLRVRPRLKDSLFRTIEPLMRCRKCGWRGAVIFPLEKIMK